MCVGDMDSTGYGPSSSKRLLFNGDADSYELWEVKFKGHLRLRKLHEVLEMEESEDDDDESEEQNALVFAELIQLIDDRSLSLIINDCANDGKKALKTLRKHYMSNSKSRVIGLYTELTCLQLQEGQELTDFIIKAETAATRLKEAGENISDALLTAMILKGLPPTFQTFSTIISQREDPITFKDFKAALRTFEENEKTACKEKLVNPNDSIMTAGANNITCYSCGRSGHKAAACHYNKGDSRYSGPTGRGSWRDRGRYQGRYQSYGRGRGRGSYNTGYTAQYNDNDNGGEDDAKDAKYNTFCFKIGYDNELNENNNILIDTGATVHIINDKTKFISFDNKFNTSNHTIELADGSRQNGVVLGKGTAKFTFCDTDGKNQNILLQNSLYVPSYRQNILSVQAAIDKGASITFSPGNAVFVTKCGTKFQIQQAGRLYYLNSILETDDASRTLNEWHKTLGHCNIKDILKLKNVVNGMKIKDYVNGSSFTCETCIQGKMPEIRNRKSDEKAKNIFDLIHCDLAGPISPISIEGHKYAIMFVDDYSGAYNIYFLKDKTQALAATKQYLADISPYGSIKRFRSDNGTEFTNRGFRELMVANKICHEFSAPYSPHQNGTVERGWRTVFEMARCILIESKLPKFLWTYAALTAVHIRNRCYSNRLNGTPYEALTGNKPNLSKLRKFGSECYSLIQNTGKLDPKCSKGVFIGHDKYSPAHIIYYPERRLIRKVRCVKFLPHAQNDENIVNENQGSQNVVEIVPNIKQNVKDNTSIEHVDDKKCVENVKNEYSLRQNINKPKYLEDYVTDDNANVCNANVCTENDFNVDYLYKLVGNVPNNYDEAISGESSSKWQNAMVEEFEAMRENAVFEYTKLPPNKNVVGSKWVYAIKGEPNGDERYKARFVAKGFSQKRGIDYHETFSPTARMTSIRMLMQVSVQENLEIHQMDVKTAFLNAPIDTEIYIEQPRGFEVQDKNGAILVCKLKKSLYGLKQSGRNWNSILHTALVNNDFKQSLSDTCLYVKTNKDYKIIVLVWVDDIIIAASNKHVLNEVKTSLHKQFKMKDLGTLSSFLNIEFVCGQDYIEVHQTKLIQQLLLRFDMTNCKPKSMPCEMASNKLRDDDSVYLDEVKLYQSIIGSLIYIMTCTRPDICFAVTLLSQHLHKPTQAHLNCARHVLRYLSGTQNSRLIYSRSDSKLLITGFSDSDWGNSMDRRSVSGFCFDLNGTLVCWKSKKQQTVALSTCEAEYMALSSAVQEALFLKQLYSDMTSSDLLPVNIYVDNQGAILLAKNPVNHQRSKHIDIRYHFIRDVILQEKVFLIYVPTEENVADIFTKPASRKRLDQLYFKQKA